MNRFKWRREELTTASGGDITGSPTTYESGRRDLFGRIGLFIPVILFCSGLAASAEDWPRPQLVPLPRQVQGVAAAVISLDGTWKFTLTPPAEFWSKNSDPAAWPDVAVPGELVMQGFTISRDVEYPFKRSVVVPSDFKGRRILLRFDGVYSYARVWVNGIFIREHHGGFTSWDCDITNQVTPGQAVWITVGVTDRADEISYASNYAKHYLGGILRDVKLVALPLATPPAWTWAPSSTPPIAMLRSS